MSYKRNKRYILHLISMLMLLLVHLDTYGYDLICSYQNDNSPSHPVSSEVTFSSDEAQLEWTDSDYRPNSPRQAYSEYTTLHPDILFSWILKPYARNAYLHPIPTLDLYSGIAVYLAHCLFII